MNLSKAIFLLSINSFSSAQHNFFHSLECLQSFIKSFNTLADKTTLTKVSSEINEGVEPVCQSGVMRKLPNIRNFRISIDIKSFFFLP